MLSIRYSNNKISSANSSVYKIETDKDNIEIIGLIPADAYVTARIVTPKHSLVVPLSFSNLVGNNSKFKNKIYLTDFDIANLAKADSIYLKIYINQVVIPGEVAIAFDSKSVARQKSPNESAVVALAKEITGMKTRLDSYMNKNFKFDKTNQIRKGMVPVAVDRFGNYKWDFPFNATEQLILELSQNVVAQAELVKVLTERVSKLEAMVQDHITESYYI